MRLVEIGRRQTKLVSVWWMPLQPSQTVVWALWILALSKAENGDQRMDRTRSIGVVKARTIKWLPPGERWNGSLLDEARDSELAPVLRGCACPTTTTSATHSSHCRARPPGCISSHALFRRCSDGVVIPENEKQEKQLRAGEGGSSSSRKRKHCDKLA